MYEYVGSILKKKPMDDLHNFKNYKKAKVYVQHLEAILKVVDLSVKGLSLFEVYIPVHRILVVMKDERRFLESHLKEQQEIIRRRGK